jgi:thiol:disulfide interchange protein DsbD
MIRWLFAVLCLCCALVHADEFLDPAVAFKPSARALNGQTIEVRFAIARDYYLYRDKFRFAAEPATVQLGDPALPPGKEKDDETFGKVAVYYDEAIIRLPVERNSSGVLPLTLKVTSQGCADAGLCYPPQQQRLSVQLPDPATTALASDEAPGANESGRIAQLFRDAGFWLLIGSFFGFGLLLSLTPCVFPMIPILSSIIVGSGRDGHGVSHARGFSLSLAYVLGMALTYAAVGIAAGLTGTLLAATLQNGWVLGGFAAVFVVLSLSMFGFYELQLPTFLQSRVSEEASHLRGGSLPGVAAMGALSAIIVGPCVAAPLAGALLYIGQSGDALLGGAALFAMGLGMGAPLLAVGASAGTLLPQIGAVDGGGQEGLRRHPAGDRRLAGFAAVAGVVQMLAWALLLILPAIYLHALDPLPPHARGWQRFWKGIGDRHAALRRGDAARHARRIRATRCNRCRSCAVALANSEARSLPFTRVQRSPTSKPDGAAGQPVLLDFYADWCVSCKEMERFTFADARVQASLAGWTLLQADVTANSAEDQALLQRFRLYGPPAILFFDRRGQEIEEARVIGFQPADAFLNLMSRLGQRAPAASSLL